MSDDDADLARGTPVLKVTAVVVGLAGAFTGLAGIQALLAALSWYRSAVIRLLPVSGIAFGVLGVGLGVLAVVLGALVYRARAWAAVLAAVVALFGLAVMCLQLVTRWQLWGELSAVTVLSVAFWLASIGLTLASVPAARAASAARARMRARGEDLGV